MKSNAPLSEILRPKTLKDVMGQAHLVGENGFLTHLLKQKKVQSLLLFGPPGTGKTTLARLYAKELSLPFHLASGVFGSVADLKKRLKENEAAPLLFQKTVVFVDEIHRLNRANQDLFLPLIEDGTIVLVGATTENPSFCINSALLSRMRVLELHSLSERDLGAILEKALHFLQLSPMSEEIRQALISLSKGDARHLLNLVEMIDKPPSSLEELTHLLHKRLPLYDRDREAHYNLISALHKSIRGSDPDAALYWLARILNGGEAREFVGRRLVRMAVEDIGLAEPESLKIALAAWETFERLGSPEGDLALAEAAVYLALAPKSNRIYTAFKKATACADKTSQLMPPKIILNQPTTLMKELGYGEGYLYDPDTPQGFSGQNYFPDDLPRETFYEPIERGFERELVKRIAYFNKLRKSSKKIDRN